jgi:hypothetical protein
VEVEQRDIGAENKVPLEELCRKSVDLCIKSNQFSGGTLAQASGLTSTLEATWRRREVARHLQQQVEARRSTLQRLQLQLTAHNWLHEDTLMMQGAALSSMAAISKCYSVMTAHAYSDMVDFISACLCPSRRPVPPQLKVFT